MELQTPSALNPPRRTRFERTVAGFVGAFCGALATVLTPYWFVFLRWLTGCSDQTSWTGILTGVVVYSVIAAGLGFVWSIAASQFRVAFAVPPLRRNGWLAVPALMFTITAAYLNIGIAQHPVGYTAPPDCDIYE